MQKQEIQLKLLLKKKMNEYEKENLQEKLKSIESKIEEKKKEYETKKKIIKLKKEYQKLTYPERHPILYKIKSVFTTLGKEANEWQEKAQKHNKENSWEY